MTDTLFDAPQPKRRGIGPTKVVDRIINPGERMLQWAWRKGREGVPLRDERARTGGINVHQHAELLTKGGRPDYAKIDSDGERNATMGLIDWWDHVQPLRPQSEVKLDDGTFNGYIDLVFACRGCGVCRRRWRCGKCGQHSGGDDWTNPEISADATRPCVPCKGQPSSMVPWAGYWVADFKAVESSTWLKEKWFFQVGAAYRRLWDWHAGLHELAPSCGGLIVMLHTDTADSRTIQTTGIDPAMAGRGAAWYQDVLAIENAIALQR